MTDPQVIMALTRAVNALAEATTRSAAASEAALAWGQEQLRRQDEATAEWLAQSQGVPAAPPA